ncbi:hypothetical protein LP420_09250 [Massilia sp. B-10]|nr:hypothetical protein LP420_09250 [Massilia sp. B-10]
MFGHHGVLKSGALKVGDAVNANVDEGKRAHHPQSLGHAPDAQGAA